MKVYTKAELIDAIRYISSKGWIENTTRKKNDGAIGNILEDMLEIEENNLPIPNAAEWELKAGRNNASVLTTLFHTEPSPRAFRFVPQILLPLYGWKHEQAGKKYPVNEMSFRATLKTTHVTDRGFTVIVDDEQRKVTISFQADKVDISKHGEWLNTLEKNVGLGDFETQPYWGFNDLTHVAGTKLLNMFYVGAERKRENSKEYFKYTKLTMLREFSPDAFIDAIRQGKVYVDFDARTGHNHGTKFRTHSNYIQEFYAHRDVIFDTSSI